MAEPNSTGLTAELLRSAFNYDPMTGLFTRTVCADRSHVGDTPCSLDDWGYIRFRVFGRKYRAHRLAWLYVYGSWPSDQIDHINGVKTDNRIANLRDVAQSINQQNRFRPRADSRIGILGVNFDGKAYRVQLTLGKRKIYVGTYKTVSDAHAAYLEAKRRFHPGFINSSCS